MATNHKSRNASRIGHRNVELLPIGERPGFSRFSLDWRNGAVTVPVVLLEVGSLSFFRVWGKLRIIPSHQLPLIVRGHGIGIGSTLRPQSRISLDPSIAGDRTFQLQFLQPTFSRLCPSFTSPFFFRSRTAPCYLFRTNPGRPGELTSSLRLIDGQEPDLSHSFSPYLRYHIMRPSPILAYYLVQLEYPVRNWWIV